MRGSGVTAARSCLQPLVSASRYLAVHALPGDPLYFIVEAKSKIKDVYEETCEILRQQRMQDCELFGLAILSDGEYLFIDPESKLSKYAPKNWRSSHTYGLDCSGRPAFVLHFRVRYYIETPGLLRDEASRHHYYLQLRDNVVRHGGGVESLKPQHHPLHAEGIITPLFNLAGLALQADFGDYAEDRHRPHHAGSISGYCKPSDYLPPHMCVEPNVLAILAAQHRDNRGLSREEAELQYIRETLLLEAPINAHLYRLRRSKNENGPGRVLLAICSTGVRIYTEENVRVFAWNDIGKISFDKKKFEIRAVGETDKLTLYGGCDEKSKLLLTLCRGTHQFTMTIAERVNEAKKIEEDDRKVLRECYMYPARCKLNMTTRSSRADQRISVISTTSSNTTSGIVSDRVHSEDEPDTAPASTECLARLTETSLTLNSRSTSPLSTHDDIDGINLSTRLTSTTNTLQTTSITTSTASSLSLSSSTTTTTTTTTATTATVTSTSTTATATTTTTTLTTPSTIIHGTNAEGSQCSSSCSTVVINNPHISSSSNSSNSNKNSSNNNINNNNNNNTSHRRRRTSASSSLELGYSHTAQNSIVSNEIPTFPGAIYDRCKKTDKYNQDNNITIDDQMNAVELSSDTSGIYTLRSSAIQDDTSTELYSANNTIESSIRSTTTDEASVTSGFYTIHSGLRSETSDVYTDDASQDHEEPIYSVCKGDEDDIRKNSHLLRRLSHLDDQRSRSNSVLSTNSFRGDGTDVRPSGIGSRLTAEELADLIVGRYPPKKTISTSMDSDCDYVSMPPPLPPGLTPTQLQLQLLRQKQQQKLALILPPPPPPPPPRIDSNERKLPPPPPYPSMIESTRLINKNHSDNRLIEREPPPPPPYNAPRADFIPLPPRRNEQLQQLQQQQQQPPLYLSSREIIQIPPPTPPRNDAITPREPPPPPPPYPNLTADKRKALNKLYPETIINQLITNTVAPKPPPRIQPPTYPGDKMKPTPVHAPVAALVVGPNNYLDVHASKGTTIVTSSSSSLSSTTTAASLSSASSIAPILQTTTTTTSSSLSSLALPPPPPPLPPLPSSNLTTVYTSQIARSQIEQYRQQLYSDVDFVMFPIKDPALSKQDYIDAKQGTLLSGMAAAAAAANAAAATKPPPPYPSFKNNINRSSLMYLSSPHLNTSLKTTTTTTSSLTSSNYTTSNLNLSDTSLNNYQINNSNSSNSNYAISTSSLYSGGTCSSSISSHSLRRQPPAVPLHSSSTSYGYQSFSRTKSNDNILKCFDAPVGSKLQCLPQPTHARRLPPPPPPPQYEIQSLEKNHPLPSVSGSVTSSSMKFSNNSNNNLENNERDKGMLDIRTLREKSKNLDLPLISALCNDHHLLKQTKAFVMPKHPSDDLCAGTSRNTSTTSSNNISTSSKNKYPVSGLSTTQISKTSTSKKSLNISHRHPSEIAKLNVYKVNPPTTRITAQKDLTRASHS